MKTARRLAFLPALAALAFVQACSSTLHSGLLDWDNSDQLGKASTSLAVPMTYRGAETTGKVWLTSGSATVSFTTPAGAKKTWEFAHGGGGSMETFEVGYETLAGAGSYSLEITGSETAMGGYDLSLDVYPR